MKEYTPSKKMNDFLDELVSLCNKYEADISPCADGKRLRVDMDGEMIEFVTDIEECDCQECSDNKSSGAAN